jgi:hypothetical protein
MISKITLLFLLVCGSSAYAQVSDSEMERLKINWRVELRLEGHELALKLEKEEGKSSFSDSIQRLFLEDTFVVENLLRKQLEKESTTLGINKANLACTSEYEQLVDKYFAILSAKMTTEDKDLLASWQKDWKSMMDEERKLIGKFMQEEYSGGGSIQSIEYTNRLMLQQKNHLLLLINYLTHLI